MTKTEVKTFELVNGMDDLSTEGKVEFLRGILDTDLRSKGEFETDYHQLKLRQMKENGLRGFYEDFENNYQSTTNSMRSVKMKLYHLKVKIEDLEDEITDLEKEIESLEMLEGVTGYKFRNVDDMTFYPNDTNNMTPNEMLEDIKMSFMETFMMGREDEDEGIYVEVYKNGEGYVGCDEYSDEIRFDYY